MQLPPQWNIHPAFHTSLLMPYIETKEHGENFTRPPPNMIEGKAEYEVEAIRAHQHRRRKLQYLIKWKGYPESDNTWEPVNNVQVPQLIRKHHAAHPLEDKRMTEQARTISSTPHPTWLLKSNPRKTFDNAEATAAALAATVKTAGLPSPPTPTPRPLSPSTHCTSLSNHCFVTPPSIPQINLSTFTHVHYWVKIPTFSSAPHSIISLMSTETSTCTFAEILTVTLTDKCWTVPTTPPIKCTTRHTTCPASPHPQNLPTAPPLQKSRCLQMLPPSFMPPSLVASPSRNTHQSHLRRLRPSLPST